MRSRLAVINVYRKSSTKSEVVTQILYGDTFKKIQKKRSWIKIKNESDNYKGFIKNNSFLSNQKNSHKVCDLFAKLYSKPNFNSLVNKKLSFGTRINVTKKKKKFFKFDNLWIQKKI